MTEAKARYDSRNFGGGAVEFKHDRENCQCAGCKETRLVYAGMHSDDSHGPSEPLGAVNAWLTDAEIDDIRGCALDVLAVLGQMYVSDAPELERARRVLEWCDSLDAENSA